jgi:hypothetical protein
LKILIIRIILKINIQAKRTVPYCIHGKTFEKPSKK